MHFFKKNIPLILKTANKFSENVAKFKNFGMIITNQNYIHYEIRSRLKIKLLEDLTTSQFIIFQLLCIV